MEACRSCLKSYKSRIAYSVGGRSGKVPMLSRRCRPTFWGCLVEKRGDALSTELKNHRNKRLVMQVQATASKCHF